METVCGQCGKEYSKECRMRQHCPVHRQLCFGCKLCVEEVRGERVGCFACAEECYIEEAYYDMRCESYLCKKQFIKLDLSGEEVTLPCGCLQLKEHIIAFMSAYCLSCLRKLTETNSKELRHCRLCILKDKVDVSIKTVAGEKESLLKEWQKHIKVSDTVFNLFKQKKSISEAALQSQPQNSESESQPMKQQNKKLMMDLLSKDLEKVQEQLSVSQFTRLQLRKLILEAERDKQCPICIQLFTTNRKPMMICMQQHLICEVCFKERITLLNCPLCTEVIQRDKVRPSRERMRTLQLENVMVEKYESKLKRYSTFCSKNITQLKYKFEIKDAEIQTNAIKLQDIPTKPIPVNKRPLEKSAAKKGGKRIKQQA